MKTPRVLLFLFLSVARLSSAAPWVTETPTEFGCSVDLDANGSDDILLVDRQSGMVRFGLQNGSNTFQWIAPKRSGLRNIQAATVGNFGLGTEVALTAPEANRITFLDPFSSEDRRDVFPSIGIGFGALAAFGSGNNGLAAASEFGASVSGAALNLIDGLGQSQAPSSLALESKLSQGHTMQLAFMGPHHVAFRSADRLKIWAIPTLQPELQLDAPGFPTNSNWLSDFFDPNTPLPQVLYYVDGESTLSKRQVVNNSIGSVPFTLGSTAQYDLLMPIRTVMSIQNGNSPWLLVLNETTAKLFNFNGHSAPVLRQSWTAPLGEAFTNAIKLSNGHFCLFSGTEGRSTRCQRFNFNGSTHTLFNSALFGSSSDLENAGSHVFGFLANPFLYPEAPLQAMASARDWTSGGQFGTSSFVVASESDRGTSLGLGNPTNQNITLPGWIGGIPILNQISPDCALYSYADAESLAIPQLRLSPPPGSFTGPVSISLSFIGGVGPMEIFFRISPSPTWQLYTGPITLTDSSQIMAFGRISAKSSQVVSATYLINHPGAPTAASSVDSDGDCLDDSWELAFGQSDPNQDPDGDNHTNLQEYRSGTDPLDPTSFNSASGQEIFSANDLEIIEDDASHFRLQWRYPGDSSCVSFQIWGSSTLANGDWVLISTSSLQQPDGSLFGIIQKPTSTRYFYRIVTVH